MMKSVHHPKDYYNQNHSELESGEYFVGNINMNTFSPSEYEFEYRLGEKAYDFGGDELPNGYKPMFAEKESYDNWWNS